MFNSQVFGLNSEEHGDASVDPKGAEDGKEIVAGREQRAQRKAKINQEIAVAAADEERLQRITEDAAGDEGLTREEAEVEFRRARVKLGMGGLQRKENSARGQSEMGGTNKG